MKKETQKKAQKDIGGGFWGRLNKPFFVLAPMADVTDVAFRRMITKYGKPDVMWTEFVSADGLFLADKEGQKKIKKDLEYSEEERPIVAQFFTSDSDMMLRAAKYTAECGFDGFDINMGCPDRSIEKQNAGAALIKSPEKAKELIRAAKEGVAQSGRDIPVSVKTRTGYSSDILEEWLPVILEEKPAVITIHARTRKEMSKVPADWARIKRAVEIRDEFQNGCDTKTLIIGNGDVVDLEDAQKKADETMCDGVMLGRAIFGTPWLFSSLHCKKSKSYDISYDLMKAGKTDYEVIEKRLNILIEHTKLFGELLPHKNFAIMKKHYKAYVSGWDGAKELRIRLMGAEDVSEIESIVLKYLKT